ncbi:MAG: twin-arginine translocation signal domain-containing protein [Burkholderiaceae bacterium]|nr:MAG: twin-arginine translocation signal domain-containing protein [Burkholderiaceae bacterium]
MKKAPSAGAPQRRRQFLKLSTAVGAAGALPLLQTAGHASAAEDNVPVRIGYLPVTDAAPLLIAHGNKTYEAQGLKADKPRLFRSWAQIAEAFLSGQVNVVHLLMPMTIWARYGSKAPAKVVAWNHMEGSSLTVLPEINHLSDLGGKTVAIPFWYSIHNVVVQYLFRGQGLQAISEGTPGPKQVKLVVMSPGDMLPALGTKQIAGYTVAEPFNALAETLKVGKIWRFTGDVWKDHACCVVFMHERDLEQRPQWSQKVVNSIVQAQAWIRDHRDESAHMLAKDNPAHYTPHTYETLAQVMAPHEDLATEYKASGAVEHTDWNEKRIDFQPYPFPSYTEELVKMLKQTYVSGRNDFLPALDPAFVARDLVDDRFVKKAIADLGGMSAFGLPGSFTRHETISRS